MDNEIEKLLDSLSKSKFRGSFHLNRKMIEYAKEKGFIKIQNDAKELINKRIGEAEPKNDGKQTPMKGHPVFIAQHAPHVAAEDALKNGIISLRVRC